ncbi:hypothetical protein L1887_43299 [Cichorium endivia]|nr:hypothetical protein L1887_43299 [Cichorium endivia]
MGMLGRRAGKRVKAVGVGGRSADSNNKLGGAAFVTTWASGRVSEPSQRRVLSPAEPSRAQQSPERSRQRQRVGSEPRRIGGAELRARRADRCAMMTVESDRDSDARSPIGVATNQSTQPTQLAQHCISALPQKANSSARG